MVLCVCVCEREREREKVRETERDSERLPESNERFSDFLFYSYPEQGSCPGMYRQMQICYAKKLPWRRQKTHPICHEFANI